MFLFPSEEIITWPSGKTLFPEFFDIEEKVGEHSLPFDMKLLQQDIADFYNPPLPPKMEQKTDVAGTHQTELQETSETHTVVSSTDTSADGLDTRSQESD